MSDSPMTRQEETTRTKKSACSVADLLDTVPDLRLVSGSSEETVTDTTLDSREVLPGWMFAATKGDNSDGHSYIADAISRGASVILLEREQDIDANVVVIQTSDVRDVLGRIAHLVMGDPSTQMAVIGVTGTNGKTTCAYIARSILQSVGLKTALIGTTGNSIETEVVPTGFTTPEAPEIARFMRRASDAGCRALVMEVSSHGLALGRTQAIDFDAALFTNLSHDHLDFHGTMENYARAKKLLFDGLKPEAFALVNGDSAYAHFMVCQTAAQKVFIGHQTSHQVRILDESFQPNGAQFTLSDSLLSWTATFESSLNGGYNVENLALVVSCLVRLGLDLPSIQQASTSIQPVPGRLERHVLPNGALVFIDYAHTPDALEKALKTCRQILVSGLSKHSTLTVVFGCGGDRDRGKRPLMGQIAVETADSVVLTSDNPRSEDPWAIIEDVLYGISPEARELINVVVDRAEAIRFALSGTTNGDVVLIAGKGHEEYQVIGNERLYFSDRVEVERFTR